MAKNQGNGTNNADEKQEEVVVATAQTATTETTPVVEPVKEAATDVVVEQTAPAPAKVEEEVVVATKEKTRKVQGIEDHTCHVGGKRYTIEKNKQQIVPEDVAMILQKGKKVIIL